MFGIKLYKTYNKIKHILIKPKLKVMLSPMEHQPFYLPPHVFILFDKYSEYNMENDRREYNTYFLEKIRKWIPFYPIKAIRIQLPNWMTFRIINNDFGRKWKFDNPCFEQRGYFSIVFFGIALTFYLEIPLDNEDKYHEDEYYTTIGDRLYMPVENIDELLGLYKVGFLNGGVDMKRQFREFLGIK